MSDGRSTTGADSTEILDAIARESNITLYKRFTEAEAAAILDVSVPTLRRIRERGEIAFIRISERVIRYFGLHLCEYILSKVESQNCPNTTKNDSKSVIIGGTGLDGQKGSNIERQEALAAAQRILGTSRKT